VPSHSTHSGDRERPCREPYLKGRWYFRANRFWQNLHWKGFTLAWAIACRRRCSPRPNFLPQTEHTNGLVASVSFSLMMGPRSLPCRDEPPSTSEQGQRSRRLPNHFPAIGCSGGVWLRRKSAQKFELLRRGGVRGRTPSTAQKLQSGRGAWRFAVAL
jgi:hypothetical protein